MKVADNMFFGCLHAQFQELSDAGVMLQDAIKATNLIVRERVAMGIPLAFAIHGLDAPMDAQAIELPRDMEWTRIYARPVLRPVCKVV